LGSVTWSNDSDLSYDTLYLEGVAPDGWQMERN